MGHLTFAVRATSLLSRMLSSVGTNILKMKETALEMSKKSRCNCKHTETFYFDPVLGGGVEESRLSCVVFIISSNCVCTGRTCPCSRYEVKTGEERNLAVFKGTLISISDEPNEI